MYKHSLLLYEDSSETHFNLASSYSNIKDNANAIIHFKRAIELEKDYVDSYLCLADLLVSMKRMAEAEKYYLLALGIDKANQRAL